MFLFAVTDNFDTLAALAVPAALGHLVPGLILHHSSEDSKVNNVHHFAYLTTGIGICF